MSGYKEPVPRENPSVPYEEELEKYPHIVLCRELLRYYQDGMSVPFLKVKEVGRYSSITFEYTVGDLCFVYDPSAINFANGTGGTNYAFNEYRCGFIRVGSTRICTDDIGKNIENKLVRQAITHLQETMDIVKERDYKLLRKVITELEGEEE